MLNFRKKLVEEEVPEAPEAAPAKGDNETLLALIAGAMKQFGNEVELEANSIEIQDYYGKSLGKLTVDSIKDLKDGSKIVELSLNGKPCVAVVSIEKAKANVADILDKLAEVQKEEMKKNSFDAALESVDMFGFPLMEDVKTGNEGLATANNPLEKPKTSVGSEYDEKDLASKEVVPGDPKDKPAPAEAQGKGEGDDEKNLDKSKVKPVAPDQKLKPVGESKKLNETGEPDQDYDKETIDAVVKALESEGIKARHREFDKYQGVYMVLSRDGKSGKFWWTDTAHLKDGGVILTFQKDGSEDSANVEVDSSGQAFPGDLVNLFLEGKTGKIKDEGKSITKAQLEDIRKRRAAKIAEAKKLKEDVKTGNEGLATADNPLDKAKSKVGTEYDEKELQGKEVIPDVIDNKGLGDPAEAQGTGKGDKEKDLPKDAVKTVDDPKKDLKVVGESRNVLEEMKKRVKAKIAEKKNKKKK